MSYRAGVSIGAALAFGKPELAGEPRVICDGCGLVHRVQKANGEPYAWFLKGKPPPGWAGTPSDPEAPPPVSRRRDYCARCRRTA